MIQRYPSKPITVKRSFGLALFVFIAAQLLGQTGGTHAFSSLDIQPSARVAAAGGQLPAVRDGDLSLAIFNPALLDSLTHNRVSLSYVNYFSGVNLGYAGYAHHLDSLGITVSGTLQYVNYGQFSERNIIGQETGNFSAGDYALILGAAKPIDSLFTAGINLKTVYSNLAGFNAWGMAVDGGVTYFNPDRRFTAALVVRNLGFVANGFTDGQRDSLRTNVLIAFSKRLKYAPLRFSVVYDNIQQWDLTTGFEPEATIDPFSGEEVGGIRFPFADNLMRHFTFGAEILLSDNLYLNVGYNYRRRQELKLNDRSGTAGLSYGLGFRINRFNIAYGRAIYHFAGPSNHFTLTTRLSDW